MEYILKLSYDIFLHIYLAYIFIFKHLVLDNQMSRLLDPDHQENHENLGCR